MDSLRFASSIGDQPLKLEDSTLTCLGTSVETHYRFRSIRVLCGFIYPGSICMGTRLVPPRFSASNVEPSLLAMRVHRQLRDYYLAAQSRIPQ